LENAPLTKFLLDAFSQAGTSVPIGVNDFIALAPGTTAKGMDGELIMVRPYAVK